MVSYQMSEIWKEIYLTILLWSQTLGLIPWEVAKNQMEILILVAAEVYQSSD